MVEAIHSVQEAQLSARLARAAITLAHREAEKAVTLALKGQGLKPRYIARREIVTLAKDYLAAHPELIAEAKPIVEQWRREGFFGKRAAPGCMLLNMSCSRPPGRRWLSIPIQRTGIPRSAGRKACSDAANNLLHRSNRHSP